MIQYLTIENIFLFIDGTFLNLRLNYSLPLFLSLLGPVHANDSDSDDSSVRRLNYQQRAANLLGIVQLLIVPCAQSYLFACSFSRTTEPQAV